MAQSDSPELTRSSLDIPQELPTDPDETILSPMGNEATLQRNYGFEAGELIQRVLEEVQQ